MNLIHKNIVYFLILGFAFSAGFAQTNQEITEAYEDLDEEGIDETIAHHEEIIAKYPEEVFIPNIMFELAELYVSKADIEFKRSMTQYEADLKKYENGELSIEPIMPQVSFKKSIEICYKLLEKYPQTEYRDKVIYRLAMCHLDEGNQQKAKDYFQKLVYECPQSPKISEAHFRLGEFYFNEREFNQAIDHYKELLDNWDDPFFNMALYKLGWAYFNINDYSNSVSTYIYLISDIKLLEELDTELLGKTKADVKNEAIEYIAHSLTEYGGPELAKSILKSKIIQEYAISILEKMGEIYKKRNYYEEAIDTYNVVLELYPFYPYAPNIQKQIIECYEKDMKEEKVFEEKEEFVEKYGPDSKWMAQYPDGKIRNEALTQVQEKLFSLGTYYQSKAQEKNRDREYRIAIDKYNEYLRRFKSSPISYKVNYYLAECYYEIEDFDHAADEYFQVMRAYGENEFQEVAAYNRIISNYNILKSNPEADSLTFYLEGFLGDKTALPQPIKVGHEAQANLIKSCNDYFLLFPNNEKIVEVLMKYGEVLYDLNKWDLAVRVYAHIGNDENYKNHPFYGKALNMLAQCLFKLKRYDEAEVWYDRLAQVYPDSTSLIKKSRKMIATANFKKAEAMNNDGKEATAAAEFLKLAFISKDIDVAKASIFEAASYFERVGENEKAVKAYERMIEEQPELAFIDELIMKAGLLRERMGDWLKASDHYLNLSNNHRQSKYASMALYNAANCFENMSLWHRCKEVFTQYLNRYSDEHPDHYIEAQYKLGEILHLRINDPKAAIPEYRKTIKKFDEFKRHGIESDEYLVAKAQYMIAEIGFEEYKKIRITPPLQQSLKRKQTALSNVLKTYIETGKYKVADWTTASLYKAGLTFEELCESILTSPAPANLTEEKIDEYYDNLNKQLVLPFKQKALEFYKSNLENALNNNISNEWTEKSKERAQALIAELGIGGKRYNMRSASTKKTNYISNTNGGGS
ncbi:tetratricopeptide repeat protein [candidate division KSB1 bacterium]|nr:tetratricopeptide repeat protein [candidate division KSB1 bacterium]